MLVAYTMSGAASWEQVPAETRLEEAPATIAASMNASP
jgi:hypothetical protein